MAIKKSNSLGLSKEDTSLIMKNTLDFDDLDLFRKELRKEFGSDTAIDDESFITEFISTGIDPLDYALGGGIPQGKLCEFAGREGTGKSSFGIMMLGRVQKLGGLGVLIDTETGGAGDRFRFENFDVDTKKCIISVEDKAEKAFTQIERVANFIAKKNITAPSLLVLDSVAGLTTAAEVEGDMESAHVAVTARMIKKGIQRTKTICRETNLAVLFVNQTRIKLGGMVNPYTGPEYTTPGGDTLKFQAITRIFVERGKTLTNDKKLPEGHIVKAKIIKCKTNSSNGRVIPMKFYYDKRGYYNPGIVYDLLNDSGYLGSGAWKKIVLPDGTEKSFNGESTFISLFNESEQNRAHFIQLMKDAFKKLLSLSENTNYSITDDVLP